MDILIETRESYLTQNSVHSLTKSATTIWAGMPFSAGKGVLWNYVIGELPITELREHLTEA